MARSCYHFVLAAVRRSGQQDERSATHPRFVVRNTISICFAFWLGWLGLWNVMPSYSSYPASTISVIVYTYTGATPSVTLRRVAGVVLGKVAGAILQLAFAVKDPLYAVCFGVAMWILVALTFFQYLHSDKDFGYVCCLTAAFAAGNMIPSKGEFRRPGDSSMSLVLPSLMNTIIQTVLGITILMVVDNLLASRASHQAWQRLLRALRRSRRHVAVSVESDAVEQACRTALLKDLDALQELLPYAAAEPTLWSPPFKTQLYNALESKLRATAQEAATLAWVLGEADARARLSSERYLQDLLDGFRMFAVSSISEIQKACEGIALREAAEDSSTAREVRRRLQRSLYTVQAAGHVVAGTRRALGWTAGTDQSRSTMSSGNLASAASAPCLGERPSLHRKMKRLYDQVVHEHLTTPDGSFTDGDAAPTVGQATRFELEDFLPQLRAQVAATENLPTALPHQRVSCAVEIVIRCMQSILHDIRTMQLAVLEY
eukprot:TRINITY_DN96106_c0_g1_i1.p1 TRINITY_DN96106_c0_g1~~TRINITY_DN96106_c0_g1_i1.p1  ORF type:complete len:489 (+),score=73.19 TRINITY_DN96106_c0_g1_i1:57-1523(+)